jgi:hypothetical protein
MKPPTISTVPPTYAQLAAGLGRYRPLQGRDFRFTLGGGEDKPPNRRTREAIPLGDPDPIHYAVAEWGYSFHHLKDGQLDGAGQKHFGGYPTPPRTRAEAMEVVRRYYLRLRETAQAKATPEERRCLISINGHYCYQHYACEWGCDVVGSEVGENINSIQSHIAFTRGAARQYGKPWLIDFSSWYGPSMFDEDPRRTWGENSGPTHGHSISLHSRTYYAAYMAGANVVVAEGGWLNCFRSQQPGIDGLLPLSALGQEAARFYRFTRRHPDRGIPYAPIGIVLPFAHGIYPGFPPKLTWNVFPYQPGDQRILDTLNSFFPGSLGDPDQQERPDNQPGDPSWKDPNYMRTESLRLVASPYGDIVDVILSNAPLEILLAYPVLVLAGELMDDPALKSRLRDYERQGGTIVVSPASRSLREQTLARLRRELIPIEVSGRVQTLYNRTSDGWIVTIINNEGITKTFREAPRIDPKAEKRVKIGYTGRGKAAQADLWGLDSNTPLNPNDVRLSVPPGEVRIVKLTLKTS